LLEACLLGRIGFVESLLKLGASVHVRSDEGDTPLMLAAVQGSCGVVSRLIDAGSDLDAVNGHGLTALMEAAFWGNTEVVQLLLERGADASATDCQGRTALDWAVHEDRRDIVDLLDALPRSGEASDHDGSEPTVSLPDDEARKQSPDGKSRQVCSGPSLIPAVSRHSEPTEALAALSTPHVGFGFRTKNRPSGERGW
jgi:ankyrin repeat protein